MLTAWRCGWDADHYIRLRRWRDAGFHPRVIYDIGAHAGAWAEMCRAIFDPERLILFEPQLDLHARAEARGKKFGNQWEVLPIALGSRDEVQVMYLTQNGAASSLLEPLRSEAPQAWGTATVGQRKVQVAALDGLVSSRALPLPDLVKIDVQGFEGEVMAGGSAVLRNAERLIVEVSLRAIYDGESLLPHVLETALNWGFQLDDINDTCRDWSGGLWQADLWLKRSGEPRSSVPQGGNAH